MGTVIEDRRSIPTTRDKGVAELTPHSHKFQVSTTGMNARRPVGLLPPIISSNTRGQLQLYVYVVKSYHTHIRYML